MLTFNKLLKFMLKPVVMLFFVFIAGLIYFFADKKIALFFYKLNLSQNFPLLEWITILGNGKIYLVLLPLIALVFKYIFRNSAAYIRTWMLWLMFLFPYSITIISKHLLGRARPIVLFDSNIFGFFGYNNTQNFHSFPSGHTTAIASITLGLAILFPRCIYWFLSICFLVMASRVLLTCHYLSDVMVSFYLVALELGLFTYIMRRKFLNIYELILNEKVK